MPRWIPYVVSEGAETLQEVLQQCGYLMVAAPDLEIVWTLPLNGLDVAGRRRYELHPGETIYLPLPEEVERCVAPGRAVDDLHATVRLRTGSDSSEFPERLDRFRWLLAGGDLAEDAYRSAFSPLLITSEIEAIAIEGLVATTFGDETGMRFAAWMLDQGYLAEELWPAYSEEESAAAVVPRMASTPEDAAEVWARYPNELSVYIAFFLRGHYIRRVTGLIDPRWTSMSQNELTALLRSRFSPEELDVIFGQLSDRRSAIKSRVRGYGYLTAIVVALVWAADDIESGNWRAVSTKAAGLLAGTWALNRILYARDARFIGQVAQRPGGWGRAISGIARTNATVNQFVRGPWLMALANVTTNSPAAVQQSLLEPRTRRERARIAAVRRELGIPEGVIIDRHGHRHSRQYMQVDPTDFFHADSELVEETEEVLWWLGVPITYRDGDVVWTVPGRSWGE